MQPTCKTPNVPVDDLQQFLPLPNFFVLFCFCPALAWLTRILLHACTLLHIVNG